MYRGIVSRFPSLATMLRRLIPKFLDFSDYPRNRSKIKNLELQIEELQSRISHSEQIDSYYRELLTLLTPEGHTYECTQKMIRVGSTHDGGYFVPKAESEHANWITFGLGANSEFENHLVRNGCFVKSFDHTITRSPKITSSNFKWVKKGWGAETKHDFTTLQDIESQFHLEPFRWNLKFDVEGAEWNLLGQIIQSKNPPKFIVCELHNLRWSSDEVRNELTLKTLRDLLSRYEVLRINGNNFSAQFTSRFAMVHDAVELLLKHRTHEFSPTSQRSFRQVNHPNDPQAKITETKLAQ